MMTPYQMLENQIGHQISRRQICRTKITLLFLQPTKMDFRWNLISIDDDESPAKLYFNGKI